MGRPLSIVCSSCSENFQPKALLNICERCGAPLLVVYDLADIRQSWQKADLALAPADMWRYEPVLPADRQDAVTLGEGFTPLLPTPRLAATLGLQDLWLKDDGQNPTASFKARGMSAAVTMAKKLG